MPPDAWSGDRSRLSAHPSHPVAGVGFEPHGNAADLLTFRRWSGPALDRSRQLGRRMARTCGSEPLAPRPATRLRPPPRPVRFVRGRYQRSANRHMPSITVSPLRVATSNWRSLAQLISCVRYGVLQSSNDQIIVEATAVPIGRAANEGDIPQISLPRIRYLCLMCSCLVCHPLCSEAHYLTSLKNRPIDKHLRKFLAVDF